MKKCRPVVKEPSGGTLLFRFALPARSASLPSLGLLIKLLTSPRRCLHGVHHATAKGYTEAMGLCLGAACTGCIKNLHERLSERPGFASALPARGASMGYKAALSAELLCLGAVCTGCIPAAGGGQVHRPLCLGAACTGCIGLGVSLEDILIHFASALPARGASQALGYIDIIFTLCLGAACTGCIATIMQAQAAGSFASALPARGASVPPIMSHSHYQALPRRCLHGVHQW